MALTGAVAGAVDGAEAGAVGGGVIRVSLLTLIGNKLTGIEVSNLGIEVSNLGLFRAMVAKPSSVFSSESSGFLFLFVAKNSSP